MKISNFKSRAAQYVPPKGWEYDFSTESLLRIPEDQPGFRPEADHMTPLLMEQYYLSLEGSQAAAIDPDQFSMQWQQDLNTSAAVQHQGHPLKGTGLA